MTYDQTGPAENETQAKQPRTGVRRWLRTVAAAGAMVAALMGGSARSSAQGLTPGGPIDFGSQPVNGAQTSLTLTFSASVATTIQSVNALTMGVAGKDFTVISQTCSGMLAPPQSCNVNIGFVPSTPGLRRGALTLVDSTGTVVNEVLLHGIGVGPQLVTAPSEAAALTSLPLTPGTFQASAVAIDGAGSIYFNDFEFSRIVKVQTNGAVSVVAALASSANTSMALDGAGTLYVTSGATVYKIAQGGVPVVFPTGGITMSAPRGIAVDGTGFVYIADATLNEIVRVGTDGTSAVLPITGLSTPLSRPNGLTIDAANVLHIADTGNSRVVNVGIYTGTSSVSSVSVTSPAGVAVDGGDSVVVTDPGALRIMVSPSNTANSGYLLGTAGVVLSNPAGLALKDNGDVVVADTADGLVYLTRSASTVNFATSTYVGHADTTDSPQSYYLQNSGNVALQFVVPTGTAANAGMDNTAFKFDAASTCPQLTSASTAGASTQLAQGAVCSYAVDFTPSVVGTNTGHATATLTTVTASTTTFAPVTTLTGTGISNTVALKVTATPSVTQPGSLVNFTVSAVNASGSTDTFYTGKVTLTATDAAATFPSGASSYTFTAADAGTHTFTAPAGVVFNTVGTFTLTATDGTYSGTSNTVLVERASSFTIAATPSTVAVGGQVGYTVTAMFNGAAATNYTGTVTFSATDAAAVLGVSSYTFTAADAGTHTFTPAQGVTFNTVGTFTIGATDGTATGTSNQITVLGADAFTVSVSPTTTATGTVNTLVVTAMYHGAVATNFRGTVVLSSTDSSATFPVGTSYTFTAADAGTHTFAPQTAGVVFHQGGDFTVNATDNGLVGTSNVVHVVGLTSFTITTIANQAFPGQALGFTITAMNGTAVATGFTGTVTFTSTDSTSTFPTGTTYTFTAADQGTHAFTATGQGIIFNQPGYFTFTATSGSVAGTSEFIRVLAADEFGIVFTPTTTPAGTAVAMTVVAYRRSEPATDYTGTVNFTSSDPAVAFLMGTSYTFTAADQGVHTFPVAQGVQFNTPGLQTVTAADHNISGTGLTVASTSGPETVTTTVATGFSVQALYNKVYVNTGDTFTVTALNGSQVETTFVGTVTFSSTDSTAVFPAGLTYTFTPVDQGVHTFTMPASGIVFNQDGLFTITAASGAASGTSGIVNVISANALKAVLAPTSTVVGSPVALTVTAYLGSNVATAYRRTVTFSSTDPAVSFLMGTSYTFTAADAGTHTFTAPQGVQFNTVGNQTVGVGDGTMSATSNVVTVNSLAVGGTTPDGFTIVATPAATTIGTPVSYTITATEGGVTATGFTGTVTLSATDSTANFLSGTTYTFTTADNGSHTFTAPASGVKFNRAGTFTISATNGTASGTSNNVVVSAPSTATAFTLTATPATTGIGTPVGLTISAVNSSGAIATDYTGTVTFSASDPLAKFLGGTTYTFTAADAGTHTFAAASGVQFNTAGTQTASATDGSISGTSNAVTVLAADSFTIAATPTTTTAGSPVNYTITAMLNGAVATNFTGTVTLSSTDGLAKFLGGTTYTFTSGDAGVHTFSGTSAIEFESVGTFTITATAGTISGTSNAVTVLAPASFQITANPSSTTAGAPVSFTVSAVNGTMVNTGYTGTVAFTSTDSTAKFLSGVTYTFTSLDQGTHTFTAPASGVTFNQGGTFTVSATDGTLNGTSNNVTVLAATGFSVTATPTVTSIGKTVTFVVTAVDVASGTVIPNYTGTIGLSSTDSSATFLGGTTYTFTAGDNGTHTFTAPTSGVAFNQTGTFTITATSGALTGTSNGVQVIASGTGFTITATPTSTTVGAPVSFTITANTGSSVNTAYRGTVTFSATDALAKFLSGTTYTFTAADNGSHTFTAPASGVQFNEGGTFTISATDGTLSGTSNAVTVLAPTGFAIVATPSSTTIGGVVSYTLTAVNVGSGGTTVVPNYTGTVTFSSTDSTANFLSGTTYTFTTADKGSHTFTAPASGVQFNQAGTFTISATDGSTNGTSNSVVVNPVATGFTITATPSTTTIGVPVSFTISATNGTTVVTNYTGTVTFTTTDTTGKFLSGTSYTFTSADNGTHTFTAPASGVQFNQAGSFTVSATDGVIRGTSNLVLVNPKATAFVIVASPSTTTVGTPVSFTVSAVNNGTVITNYTGTVTFTATDAGATFLAGTSYTFTTADSGVKTFTAPASGVKFSAPGTYTVSASDGTISGKSNNVVVSPMVTGFTLTATPTTTTVGTAVSYTITAVNGTSTATGYTGTVTFTATDSGATFLSGATYTFTAADNGTHTFTAPASGVKFSKPGTFTISASDGTNTGTSNNVVVNPVVTGFSIVATPSTTTVGTAVSYTVTVLNGTTTVPGYTGTVTFTATDATAKFLSGTSYTFAAADNGVHTFTAPAGGVQFNTAGTFTISATDGTYSGTSNNVVVNPAATGFVVVATPSTTTVGTAVSYTVTAVSGTSTSTAYTGTVTLTSTDTTVNFLSGTTLTFTAADNGTKTFTAPASGVTFNTAGTFTISANDGKISGTSNNVVVNRVATGFTITVTPSTTTVGTVVSYTITAVNSGTVVPSYTGTVTLTSTDATAKFPSGTTLTFTAADNGTKTFTAPASGVQFNAPGVFTVGATDGTISGTSNNVTVVGPNGFTVVASPSTTTIGAPVGFTVSATYNGAIVTNYTGTVALTSSDPLAKFLSGSTFTFTAAEQGVHVVSVANGVSFGSLGTYTVTATSGTIAGTSNGVTVTAVAAVLLNSSANPVLTGTSIMLTAMVPGSSSVIPTGSVTFMDGTTTLGSAMLDKTGTATLPNVSFTLLGTHSLTAVYSGDVDFSPATSAALLEVVEDFSIGLAPGQAGSQTILGGHTGTYQLALTPLGGPTFAAPVTFTATGLPTGAKISFTAASLNTGEAATNVAFTITPPVQTAMAKGGGDMKLAHLAPLTALLAMIGLGAFGNRRKRLARLLMLTLALLPLTAMTGCLSAANDGYYGAAPTSYTITITATSGSLTHTTQVTLNTQ